MTKEKTQNLPQMQHNNRKVDRYTILMQIHHQHENENPKTVKATFAGYPTNREEMYVRNYKPKKGWSKLDVGFHEFPGMFFCENRYGKIRNAIPTEEEKQMMETQVFKFAFRPIGVTDKLMPGAILRPGNAQFFEVDPETALWVWSPSGDIPLHLAIITR